MCQSSILCRKSLSAVGNPFPAYCHSLVATSQHAHLDMHSAKLTPGEAPLLQDDDDIMVMPVCKVPVEIGPG
jgi:hypothetical protein